MDGHDGAVLTADQVANRGPDIFPFALLGRGEAHTCQTLAELKHPRAVVPDHDVVLVQPLKELPRVAKVFFVCSVESDNHAMEIGDF